jgi:Tfp pilus assembly protein PilV
MKLFLYKNQRGFSIVEAITASVLLIVAMLVFFNIQGRQLIQFSNFRDLEKIDYSANGIFEELEAIRASSGPISNYSDVNLLDNSEDQIIINFQNLLNNTLGDSVTGDVRQLTITSNEADNTTRYVAKVRIKKGDIDQTLERTIY